MTNTQTEIIAVCDSLKHFLLAKNEKYGDSALNPTMIFSCDVAEMQIRNRIDDKLSRIKNSDELRKNDVCDLTGYLILLIIANEWYREYFKKKEAGFSRDWESDAQEAEALDEKIYE